MKGLRKILLVSWTAKKTNEWVLNKAGVKRELLDTVKARKLAYYGHTIRKQGSCLEKEVMQGTMPGARRRGRPRTAWMDNVKTWTGLSVEESIRMTETGIMEKVRPWCGQPSDRGRLKNRAEQMAQQQPKIDFAAKKIPPKPFVSVSQPPKGTCAGRNDSRSVLIMSVSAISS